MKKNRLERKATKITSLRRIFLFFDFPVARAIAHHQHLFEIELMIESFLLLVFNQNIERAKINVDMENAIDSYFKFIE